MGVLVLEPGVGVLVWTNDVHNCWHTHEFNVRTNMDEVKTTRTFYSVGKLYGLDTTQAQEFKSLCEWLDQNRKLGVLDCVSRCYRRAMLREIKRAYLCTPIAEVCRHLGVTRLLKNYGDRLREIEGVGLKVEYIEYYRFTCDNGAVVIDV